MGSIHGRRDDRHDIANLVLKLILRPYHHAELPDSFRVSKLRRCNGQENGKRIRTQKRTESRMHDRQELLQPIDQLR